MTLAELLSCREALILRGVAAGLSHREIALRLLISEPAVREHLRSARRKLGLRAAMGIRVPRDPRTDAPGMPQPEERAS